MDHNEAIQLQAAVKYVLGELSPVQRDEYEEHYFDCAECAVDIKALATFADTTREVLRQEKASQLAKSFVPAPSGWLRWLQPIVAVPAIAVLLLTMGYQTLVSVPHWKTLATQSAAPRVLPMFSLITANTRSSDSLAFRVPQGEPFGLYIDVPTDAAYQVYLLRLVDPKGQSRTLRALSYEDAQKTQVVEVNPGQSSGAYQIVVLGLSDKESDPGKAAILATMKFSVEFST
jgi:Putative zinc-finger